MQKLNKARVQLKHHGVFPNSEFIQEVRVSVPQFLASNCQTVFGLTFESVSLCDLVEAQIPREYLREAIHHLEQGDLDSGFGASALAYDELIREFESGNKDRFGHSPFQFGGDLRRLRDIGRAIRGTRNRGTITLGDLAGDAFDSLGNDLYEVLTSLRSATRLLSLGIDYKGYHRFQNLVPLVQRTMSNNVSLHMPPHKKRDRDRNDLEFCIDFSIQTALTLQEII